MTTRHTTQIVQRGIRSSAGAVGSTLIRDAGPPVHPDQRPRVSPPHRTRPCVAAGLQAERGTSKRMLRRSKTFLLFVIPLLIAATAGAQTLRLSLPEAIRLALSGGTQADLARSAAERAGVAQREALGALMPQLDAHLQQYSQTINLATFGFTLPGFPPVRGPL